MRIGDWRLVVCGLSHRTSSLEQRERLQLGGEEMAKANALFGSLREVLESVVLSTCNRIEFYFVTGRDHEPFDIVSKFYREFRGIDISPVRDLFQTKQGPHAASHLFRVAAGIDSMVLGENQILGQVKAAYSSACAVKSVSKVLHRLFHQSFRVGKQVRSDTEMGKGACSVSSAAVELLTRKIERLERPAILFIGVNQMIDLAATQLMKCDRCRFMFANRTAAKAVELARQFDAEGFGLEQLPDLLSRAEVILSCTSSPEPIISRKMLDELAAGESPSRRIIIDMAIPRDVEYPRGESTHYEVYDLEDIKNFLEGQQERREQAIPQAEQIIEQKLGEFRYWFDHVMEESIYNGRSASLESIRQEEMAPLLEKLPPALQNELNQVTRRLVERIIRAGIDDAKHGSE